MEEKQVVLKNPYSVGEFPLSFSVFYNNRIVVLFPPGKFACYDLSLQRDLELESQLNSRNFDYHWIIEDKLIAQSGRKTYEWVNNKGWKLSNFNNPMKSQPKLFEDEIFIVYFECHGEFGGTIYFYNKEKNEIHFTSSTCPNSVIKENGNYYVLSSLGHMFGYFQLKVIDDPLKLPLLKDIKKSKLSAGQKYNIGYADSSGASKDVFEYHGIQAFSSFMKDRSKLYMIHWRDWLFLSEIEDDVITVVDPLFLGEEIYTHNPVATTYDSGVTLINLDFYGIGGEREVSLMIINGHTITKIDWNSKH